LLSAAVAGCQELVSVEIHMADQVAAEANIQQLAM
jgi:hypothetical protein